MTDSKGQRHVYLRQIAQGERTSLSVLAGWVPQGARVLDLGTGSGALGAYLAAERGCVVDGVTINPDEAALAGNGYRRVEVADLEAAEWPARFDAGSYDCIVCADVLEHLRQPEHLLAACRSLLAAGGQLLVSVPNAGYCGLVAELLEGEFRYREEGLLDRTHLRFFTRRSIARLLSDEGFAPQGIETIERPLNESEFQARFDHLPPAVARYLLALPDAGTYQLLLRSKVGAAAEVALPGLATPRAALFTAQVYWRDEQGFREDRKITCAGAVGAVSQVLCFDLPPQTRGLRFDPADRPGFLHLHRMRLMAGDSVQWEWRNDAAGLEVLRACPQQQMLAGAGSAVTGGLVLLHGDDPWIQLPVEQALADAGATPLRLEVELGWPMSADYLALAATVGPLQAQAEQWHARHTEARGEADRLEQRLGALEREHAHTRSDLSARSAELQALQQQSSARQRELETETERLRARAAEQGMEIRRLAQEKSLYQREHAHVLRQFEQLAQHLRWIEGSTVFRATRPLVKAKMAVDRWLGRAAPAPLAPAAAPRLPEQRIAPKAPMVDVIVPVYRGLEDTRCCIESALASRCQTPWRLVVLNDASPEPEVTAWLREAASRDARILLLENEQNLGFVGTVNRGMSVSDENDVVLLNSDAEVANDWLDRLVRAAYRDARVASVTPFSNNATICSYPKFCQANELPPGWDTARLDAAFARANADQAVDVPTGVGFCMYIRRDCLREVGLFDVEEFGKGYGEENDFCRRAADAGWRNLHALDTFVRHAGGVSFGESKSQREIDAVEKLRRLHPSYDRLVHDYVAADPARAARMRADVQRIAASGLPVVLAVLHNRGGGTQRHALELAQHLRDQAVFLSLSPAPGGVALELLEPGSAFRIDFRTSDQWPGLLDTLRSLGVAHVHYHHLVGHDEAVLHLARELGVAWDFTAHDYYAMCTNISLTDKDDRFCGEQGDGACGRCAANAPHGDIGAWRDKHGTLLAQSRAVLAPSRDTARRLARMWPDVPVRFAPHTDIAAPAALPLPAPAPLAAGAPLRVVVLGALSRIKGADVLESVAMLASRERAPLEFHLLGFGYRHLKTQPQAALTVHGAYEDADLPRLLAWLKPDLVWFPAQWPETYSYTLSACLAAGLPVAATDLGAFPERLQGRRWSWIEAWDQPARRWLEFFVRIRDAHFLPGQAPMPVISVAADDGTPLAGWSHAGDYARGLQPRPVSPLPDALLAQDVARAHHPHGPQARGVRQLALSALVRLRSTPLLRGVARAIPSNLQRRVKDWLVA